MGDHFVGTKRGVEDEDEDVEDDDEDEEELAVEVKVEEPGLGDDAVRIALALASFAFTFFAFALALAAPPLLLRGRLVSSPSESSLLSRLFESEVRGEGSQQELSCVLKLLHP